MSVPQAPLTNVENFPDFIIRGSRIECKLKHDPALLWVQESARNLEGIDAVSSRKAVISSSTKNHGDPCLVVQALGVF